LKKAAAELALLVACLIHLPWRRKRHDALQRWRIFITNRYDVRLFVLICVLLFVTPCALVTDNLHDTAVGSTTQTGHPCEITISSEWESAIRETTRKPPSVLCIYELYSLLDRPCNLVDRLPGCRPRGSGFDSRRCQILWVALGLERDSLSPCEYKWGETWKKSSGCGLENWD
jgi:hypothetical protein